MPTFDLRYINIAKYKNEAGEVSYTDKTSLGEAMKAALNMKYAEGRIFAESCLADYLRRATSGTISIGTKYIPIAAQKMLFGAEDHTWNVTPKPKAPSVTIKGLRFGTKQITNYVGVAFYAPDMIDGQEKFTCVFAHKASFGLPAMTFETQGESIKFDTPTTTGEFMPSLAKDGYLLDVAIADTQEDAVAWVDCVLGAGPPAAAAEVQTFAAAPAECPPEAVPADAPAPKPTAKTSTRKGGKS